jgi:hypothetical protein
MPRLHIQITDFVKEEIKRPFVWGETDCCATANRWLHKRFGFNCFANDNIEYSNIEEAADTIGYSLIRIFNNVCINNGAVTTKTPTEGDIALIKIYRDKKPSISAAILFNQTWFSHTNKGCFFFPVNKTKLIRAYTWTL